MITIPGRIPIRIFPFFWFLIGVLGWINSNTIMGTAIWAVIIFFSVLIHEYGHALTALAFGQEAEIELVGLGGVTHRNGPRLKLWKEFLIVLNGPIAGLMLFFLAYLVLELNGVHKPLTTWEYGLTITMYANLFWTIVNLLPIHPLDGGRLLSIILESLFGMRGVKIGLFFSCAVAVLVSVLFFLMQSLLAGALFLMLAFESYRTWKSSLSLTETDQNSALQELLKQAEQNYHKGNLDVAENQLWQIRDAATQGVLYGTATEYLTFILSKKGKYDEVHSLLAPLYKKLSPNGVRIFHQAAYCKEQWKEAAEVGSHAYQLTPGYDVALINAICYSHLNEVKPAVGWLQRAVSDGLPNIKAILKKEEFDPIRSSPLFQEFSSKY